ncbi:hypothetical protein HBI76_048160 [Parastagonospora nodorum]|nr:hypothetical protein HBI76_048160 [Parastagonospora nodorum]
MYIRAGTYADVILEEHETCADRALVWTASVCVVTATNEQYYCLAFNTKYKKSSSITLTCSLLLNLQGARKRGDADRVNNNNNNERTALLAKRIKTNEDRKKSMHPGNNRNNLNIIVTNSTGREFSRVNMKSLTGLCLLIDRAKLYCKQKWAYNISKFYKSKNIQLLQPADVANVFNIVISKLDKVPTRELSSYIKTELLCDNSRKFYRLVITSEDTHCKQIIKKAYIMLLERALLILFMT